MNKGPKGHRIKCYLLVWGILKIRRTRKALHKHQFISSFHMRQHTWCHGYWYISTNLSWRIPQYLYCILLIFFTNWSPSIELFTWQLFVNFLFIYFLNRAHFFVLLFKNVIKLLYFVYFYLTELPCLVKFCTLFELFGGMLYLMFWLLQHRLNF